MNLPVRKSTRLRNFDYSNHGVYFVTICTKDKKKILSRIVGGGVLDVPYEYDDTSYCRNIKKVCKSGLWRRFVSAFLF